MKEITGKRIRKIREGKDLSQENMAAELNMSTSSYSKIERGKTDVSISRLSQISQILEVDISEFVKTEKSVLLVEDKKTNYPANQELDSKEILDKIAELSAEINKIKTEISELKRKKK